MKEYEEIHGSSFAEVSCKKLALETFTNFTGKHLFQSLSINKGLQLYQKETPAQALFCGLSGNLKTTLLQNTCGRLLLECELKHGKGVRGYQNRFKEFALVLLLSTLNCVDINPVNEICFQWKMQQINISMKYDSYRTCVFTNISQIYQGTPKALEWNQLV